MAIEPFLFARLAAGYFIEPAINHYTLTGGSDHRLYDTAKKLADCWVANIATMSRREPIADRHTQPRLTRHSH